MIRGNMLVLIINLSIIDPIAFVFDFTWIKKLTITMSKVVLKIANIDHTIIIVYLPETTLFVILVFSSILNSCFSFLKISLSVA